jgi:flagellar motor switch protein FliN/FliY
LNAGDALTRLGRSSLEAVAGALRTFLPDGVEPGAVELVPAGAQPVLGVALPAAAARARHAGSAGGSTVVVLPAAVVRALAQAVTGEEPGPEDDLGDAEVAAMGAAVSRMMDAAAAATSSVLGAAVEAEPAETRRVTTLAEALDEAADAHVVTASLTVLGHACRLVQLVPDAFVGRMTQALDTLDAEYHPDDPASGGEDPQGLDDTLRHVQVRVWAELGRRPMPIGHLVGTPPGVVLELDREADEPVDLFVNGLPFATARLLITEGGEWAVRIEQLHEPALTS